jgi:hypothetical protein
MAIFDKDNARRAHAAETARQITSSETAAFFTTLLAVLNEVEAAPRAGHHESERPAAEPGLHPADPAEPSPKEGAPADPDHGAQHAGSTDAAPAESAATVHADGVVTPEPPSTAITAEATPAGASSAADVATVSIPARSPDASADHGSSHEGGAGHGITNADPTADPAASVLQITDGINSFVDSSLATVSHVISDVGAAISQLTSSLSGMVNHLTDSLTGLASTLVHDAPVTAVVEPLLTDILGSTQDTSTHALDSTSHSIPLLDIAGAIPTAPLHPLPLHLSFLGQPTIDGHETHDAAFSTLSMHHF